MVVVVRGKILKTLSLSDIVCASAEEGHNEVEAFCVCVTVELIFFVSTSPIGKTYIKQPLPPLKLQKRFVLKLLFHSLSLL